MASQGYYNESQQQPYNGGYNQAQQGQQGYNGEYNQGYQQNPQAQYTQPPPNYNQNGGYSQNGGPQGQAFTSGKPTFDETFKLDKPKYNDLWAGILFILTFLGFVAVSGISIHGYAQNHTGGIYDDSNQFSINSNTIILFAFVLVVAFVLSWGYLLLARLFTKQFIWATGILNILMGFGTAFYYLYRKQYSAGIVFLIFAAFTVFCFITWIPRIPFSVLMLQTSVDVARNYGHVFLVSAIGGFIALVFGAWYSVTLAAVYVRYAPDSTTCSNDNSCSYARVIGLIAFITFAAYWISEWLKNTIYTTIAGVYGSWFFCGGKASSNTTIPSGATRGSFRRAITYSFGSISLGSLIVAIINCVRQLISVAQSQEAGQGNAAAACAFCILGCLVSILQWVVEFINRYAFSHIALYGKPYIAAAKDTWTMMKNRGIDALVNDCLIGPVLSMGSVFVGFTCALLAFLYLEFTAPAYNSSGNYFPVAMAFSFLIGLQVCQIFMTPLGSGVDTFFVASAWDPEVLMRQHGELYAEMIRVYPKVQQSIHA
ncbi:putative choline transporter, neither null mutation nor overexpression affects choline transport [Thelotrema lepadinum]|nr:putative choline transporter, neither null mutation nor overexpression affects choline transport [Thelotrema lepadinum]